MKFTSGGHIGRFGIVMGIAAALSLTSYSFHQYGWGGVKKRLRLSSTLTLALNNQADEDDVDPSFFVGDNAVPGRYVIALAEPNDTAPASYSGPYVAPPTDPPAGGSGTPGSGTGGTGGASSGSSTIDEPILFPEDPQPAPVVYTDTPQVAADLTDDYGGTVTKSLSQVGMFVAVNMTEAEARAMSHDSRVLSVSEDYQMEGGGITTQNVPYYDQWGLDQIDATTNTLNGSYSYTSNASNVHAYIIDSGINVLHSEFLDPSGATRATLDFNDVGYENYDDGEGHGTAVASVVGGNTCGSAKKVRLHSVKVLDGNNHASVSDVADACDWVKGHHQSPAVANMSLQERTKTVFFRSVTSAQDTAARRLANSGVTVVTIAGNFNIDASKCSPANVEELIVVGAADRNLARAKFNSYGDFNESDYGDRVDLFAAGKDVKAANRSNYNGFINFGGTSAAAPFVAGVAARYLSSHPSANHYSVQDWLINNASHKMQTGDLKGSPNRFLYAPPGL